MTSDPRPRVVRATVVAGGLTTEYLCAGSGRPLLLLAKESLRRDLIEAAPAGCRVLAPLWDDAFYATNPDGLIVLLDGLGLWDVHVVADSEFRSLASACARSSPDRFVGVLIVDPGTIDLTGALATLAR